jgi:hypothetical protein
MIQCTQTFRSTSTKEKIILDCTATCQTKHIIYLLECATCDLQYIGQTKGQLNKRMTNHRSDVKWKPNSSLAKHLSLTDHQNNFDELKVTIIEHNPNWNNKSRLERESFWIRELNTFTPNGINKKN